MSRHADLTVRWYGSETALSVQDVLIPHTTAAGPQRFTGKRSPRRRSTPPIRSSALCRRAIPRFSPRSARSAPRPISTPDPRLVVWRHLKAERRSSPVQGMTVAEVPREHPAAGCVAGTPQNGAEPPSRHGDLGCPSLGCEGGAAWSSRSCRIDRSDRLRSPGRRATPGRSLAEGARVPRNEAPRQPG